MTPKKLVQFLIKHIPNKRQVLIKGIPGIGKSDITDAVHKYLDEEDKKTGKITEICEELGYDLLVLHPVVSDPTDYKGLPVSATLNGELIAEFIPFGDLKMMIETKKKLIVFFDDLGQAAPSVQAALMQILLARQINGKKISKNVVFVAATNEKKDNAGVSGMISPLVSRFHSVITLEVDSDDWIEWALRNRMPVELIAFIKNKPKRLSTFAASKEIENFACPRTIANLGQWINDGEEDLEVWQGCVGKEFAVEFYGFYQMMKKIGNLPEQIMRDPKKAKIDLDASLLYFVLVALCNRASTKQLFATTMEYVLRIPLEFQAFYIQMIVSKYPRYKETPEYISWNVANAGVIQ